jgi:hypothetical protein
MMYDRFSYPKAVLSGFILCSLAVPFLSFGAGCGSGGGGGTDGTNTTSTNTTSNNGNPTGGRQPVAGEKPGYVGRLMNNDTGLAISGVSFFIGGQRAVSNTQGYFNLERTDGSPEVEAGIDISRVQFQGYVKNANIRSLDIDGKAVTGCTNNSQRFLVPAVARGLVWDMGTFTLYPDSNDAAPAGPCGL